MAEDAKPVGSDLSEAPSEDAKPVGTDASRLPSYDEGPRTLSTRRSW